LTTPAAGPRRWPSLRHRSSGRPASAPGAPLAAGPSGGEGSGFASGGSSVRAAAAVGAARWPEEAVLLSAAASGDQAAVRWLLDEVAPVVYGFVFARVGGVQGVAEDLLQETLLEAVRSASGFRGEAAVSTWMCAIARRRLARYYEAERRAEVARQSLRLVEGGAADEEAAVADIVERQDEVVRALGRLPALQRQVLVLKYIEGLPVQDIAAQVGRSRVQVQSLLQRGRDGLRRQLGGE
jgi:RNA polymerase sigma-70 factor (ECF subfamily)